ncbi:unnamed protein product [Pipistrellus nathusii]|uniref:Uncharacterized protein n=1 Tax=Pipistrellus nathusii TaxID=59473 RepID=A0ABN9ZMA0_PIPNA
MLGKGDLRDCGPGNKTLLTDTPLFPSLHLSHLCKVQVPSGPSQGPCPSSLGLRGAKRSRNPHQREAQGGGLGPGRMCRGEDGVRATPFGSGCWAERSWTWGTDLKGTGNRAGYLVLKKVSENERSV